MSPTGGHAACFPTGLLRRPVRAAAVFELPGRLRSSRSRPLRDWRTRPSWQCGFGAPCSFALEEGIQAGVRVDSGSVVLHQAACISGGTVVTAVSYTHL